MDKTIGNFLKTHRESITPEQVGLPAGGRRRVKGLRREEVAYLANVGLSWYTAIEQGKVHPSIQVLRSISEALLMTETDKEYLFKLLIDNNAKDMVSNNQVPLEIKKVVSSLDPNPTYLLDKIWDIKYWNDSAEILFGFSDYIKNIKRDRVNLMEYFLISPNIRKLTEDWETKAKIMVGRYRAEYLQYPKDEQFINELDFLKEYPLFREEWKKENLDVIQNGNKNFFHPDLKNSSFKLLVLQSPEYRQLKILTFITEN